MQVEYTEKDDIDERFQLLRSLYEFMASKYNMTIDDFNNFSNVAHEALSAPKLQWTYRTSFDFVFQMVTTIGETKYLTAFQIDMKVSIRPNITSIYLQGEEH